MDYAGKYDYSNTILNGIGNYDPSGRENNDNNVVFMGRLMAIPESVEKRSTYVQKEQIPWKYINEKLVDKVIYKDFQSAKIQMEKVSRALQESQFEENQLEENQFEESQLEENQFKESQLEENQFEENQFKESQLEENQREENQFEESQLEENQLEENVDFCDGIVSSAAAVLIKKMRVEAAYGYVGNRGSVNTCEPLYRQANRPVHFLKNSGLNQLKLDGYSFIVEGLKEEVDDFFENYGKKDFYFTAKSVDESQEDTVYVNIRGCLEDVKLTEIVQKQVGRLIMPAISAIPTDFLGELFEVEEFKNIFFETIDRLATGEMPNYEKLSEIIDSAFSKGGAVAEGIVDDGMQRVVEGVESFNINPQAAMVAPPEEAKSDRAASIGEKFVNKLKHALKRRNMSADLQSNGLKYVSGPIQLLTDLKANQRLQIEFDCLESAKSTACLQIRSVDSQLKFTAISKVLAELSMI